MPFPATLAAMEQAGYKRANYSRCRGCGAAIEWWNTPNKAKMIMNPMPDPDSPAVSHFATCPNVNQFRKAPEPCTSQTSTSQDSQPSLFSSSFSQPSDSSNTAAAPSPTVVKPKQKDEH